MEKIELDEVLIKKLRDEGWSYQEIVDYLGKQGQKVSLSAVRKRLKELYEREKEEEPQSKSKARRKISDEELEQLIQQGYDYREIVQHFEKQEIEVSENTIRKRIKEIYEGKKEKVPRVKRIGKYNISDEELIELREKGLTYAEIAEYLFENKDIKVSINSIRPRVIAYYERNKKQVPKNKKNHKGENKKDVPEEIIKELRKKGWSFRKIAEYLKKQGIDVSFETVRQRGIAIEQTEAGKSRSEADSKKNLTKARIIEQILKLKESRNATDEQIAKIARIYGVSANGCRIKPTLLDESELDWEEH